MKKFARQSYRNIMVSTMVILIVLAVLVSVLVTAFSVVGSVSPHLEGLRTQIAQQDVAHVRAQLTGINGSMTNLATGQEMTVLLSRRSASLEVTDAILKMSKRIGSIRAGSEILEQFFVYFPDRNRIVSNGSEEADTYLRYRITADWESAHALEKEIQKITRMTYLPCPANVTGEGRVLEIMPAPLNEPVPRAYICAVIAPSIDEFQESVADIKMLSVGARLLHFAGTADGQAPSDETVAQALSGKTDHLVLHGNSFHVQQMDLPFGDLHYFYLTSDALLNKPVRQAYLLSGLICLVFSAIACWAAVTCSRRLYHPVGTLINALISQGKIGAEKGYNELSAIGSVVDQLLEDNQELNRMLDALTPMLDDMIFYQTLHQTENADAIQWLSAFEADETLQLIVLRPSRSGTEGASQERMLKRLAQSAQDQLKPLFLNRVAIMDGEVFLVVSHSLTADEFRLKTAVALDETLREMISLFGTAALYAVSQPFPRSADTRENAAALRQMVKQCQQGFQRAFLQNQPSGGVWYIPEPPPAETGVTLIPALLETRLITLVGGGKVTAAWDELYQFLNDQLYGECASFDNMWKLLIGGVDLLYKGAGMANLSPEAVLGDYRKNCRSMRGSVTFLEAVRMLHGLFEQVNRALSMRTVGLPVSQDELDQYIDANWLKDISLCNAAEHWSLSEGYFSDVVRRLTGKNYPDYLASRRVQYAIELMRDRSLTITEISARSGFNNYKTFARCFQKYHNISPSDYRKTVMDIQPDKTADTE